jgi:hypothetical protein
MATATTQLRPGVTAQWVDPQEEQALTTDVSAQLASMPTVIDSPDTYRRAKESLPVLKRAEDKVSLFFRDIKAAAFNAHRAITAKETEQLKPIKDARTRLAGLIFTWEREQDRIRRERERQAQEEERQRQEAAALAEAEALADQGAPELADQVIEQAIAAPAPVVALPSTNLEVSGVSVRENWQFVYAGGSPGQKWKELSDEQRKRVLSLLPREYLMPDEAAIGRVVKALKSSAKIPGVQAYDAGTVAVRG